MDFSRHGAATAVRRSLSGRGYGALAIAVACGLAAAPALAQYPAKVASPTGKLTMEKLAKSSSSIIVGKVASAKSSMVGGHIETKYEIVVEEELKGRHFGTGNTATITMLGGSVAAPPLTQYVSHSATMYEGENVALFLADPKPATTKLRVPRELTASNEAIASSPRVVGGYLGKYTIFIDAKDGQKKVTHLNLESKGIMPMPTTQRLAIEGVASHRIKSTTGTIVRYSDKDIQFDEEAKEYLEATGTAPAPAKMVRKPSAEELQQKLVPSNVVVQDFASFRDQVQKAAKQ